MLIPVETAGDYQYMARYPTGDGPYTLAVADMDSDGDFDVITADYHSNNLSVLANNGKGVFSKTGQFETGKGPRGLATADIDSDGDFDIVTCNWEDDTISVLKNSGGGSFASRTDFDVDAGPFSIFLADIGEDGNGDIDVLVAADQADRISVLENDGTGGFGNLQSLRVGSRPKGIFASDLDLDGAVDVACVNWADGTVSVLQNKGDGTFLNAVEYSAGSAPRGIYITDMDGDLAPDIVCANQHDDTVSLIPNDGDGTFGAQTVYLVGDNPLSLFCGDVNRDGHPDIITTNLLNDSITVLYNDGAANYVDRTDYETGWGPGHIVFSDVNKDGRGDMIVANTFGDSISVIYSNFPPRITILEPDGNDDVTNGTYTITWSDFDPDEDAHITLYWDHDDSGLNGNIVAQDISEDNDGSGGSFLWDTTELSEGDYWIYAMIWDGVFEPVYSYSPGPVRVDRSHIANTPPTFHFTEPDGQNDFADEEFVITWADSDPDDDASISLFYDMEGDSKGEVSIISGLSEDNNGNIGIYTWDTSALPEGNYHLSALCDDGHSEAVAASGNHPVIVNHTSPQKNAPLILIQEPDGKDDRAHTKYVITWIDSDADSDAQISLYHDSDATGFDGTLIASSISEDEFGSSGAYVWDTSSLPQGDYFVYGIISDGDSDARDYGAGAVEITHDGTVNTAPSILEISPVEGLITADLQYTIRWVDLDPDDDAQISLYYDTDQIGYDGVLIVTGISEDDETDSYTWDTGDIPEGRYFIYGTIDDGANPAAGGYSHGTLEISHEPEGDDSEELTGQSYDSLFCICLSIFSAMVLILFLYLHKNPNREEKKTKLWLHHKLRKEKTESSEFAGESAEQDVPMNADDDIDEDLLPPPDDDIPPP